MRDEGGGRREGEGRRRGEGRSSGSAPGYLVKMGA